MKRKVLLVALLSFGTLMAISSTQAAHVGQPAPNFTAVDSYGQTHKLSDYAGKYVVLEWTNRACGFTRPHYISGNMQSLQREWMDKGVIWLTVTSTGFGEQGYVSADEENAYEKEMKATPTAVLMDHDGTLAHLYNAKTTPDMFVINPQGVLIYEGAIDSRPSFDDPQGEHIKDAKNYVSRALTEAMAGKPVSIQTTVSYGCEIHYAGVLARELSDEAKRKADEQ